MRGSKLIVGSPLLGVMLLAACSGSTTKTAAPKAAVATTVPSTPRAPVMGETQEIYVDKTRPTAANGDYKGAPDRTIRVAMYYPERDGKPALDGAPYPLILFSHGNGGLPERHEGIFQALIERGYVVVAPAYPLSNDEAPGGATLADVPNQPADASFVLDRVLEAGKDSSSVLRGMVDPARIGIFGHSLGAITIYGLVYNTCCADARIKAAVPISGAAAGMPGGQFFTGPHPPLLAIHGDHDDTVSYTAGKSAWDRAPSPKYLLIVVGGDHGLDMLDPSEWRDDFANAIADFFDAELRGKTEKLDAVKTFGSQPGVTKFLAEP